MLSFGWQGFRGHLNKNSNPFRRNRQRALKKPSLTYLACIKSYFDETILHGYRYVTERGRSRAERGLWMVVLLTMIASMSYVVTDYYLRFINAPTATSQQASRVPISEIPFPGVVLCPATRLNHSAVLELASEM